MDVLLKTGLPPDHEDSALILAIGEEIYNRAQGRQRFEQDIPILLRQAIDEVIDPARSKRFLFSELEKTEKTYIGTKVEILLRNDL